MKKIKLLCFPYAGGSSNIYNSWERDLDNSIELVLIELAGRGTRVDEAHYNNLFELIEDIYPQVIKETAETPYLFFGHSMGSLIAYELTQKINQQKRLPPFHVFFSGRGAPHLKRKTKQNYHLLDDNEFKKVILELGGTPLEFFENRELLELFVPLLKNDFRIVESYKFNSDTTPIDSDISVLIGREDKLTMDEYNGWKKHTTQKCNFHFFKGGHFFLHQSSVQIVDIINQTVFQNIGAIKKSTMFNSNF